MTSRTNSPYIELDELSLRFWLFDSAYRGIKETIINYVLGRRYEQKRELWALNNVSLRIEEGTRLGIIGNNGAGKSTLLKCIARIYKPTRGHVIARGFVVPLLDVGIGFNVELSGIENIYLAGAILGFTKRQMRSKVQSILDFAELTQFKDTPVKYYSHGMIMRLAFTVATEIEPEILLIDEIFSGGDMRFRQKATNRMNNLISSSKIVVFVSHDMTLIQQICNSALWLEKGNIRAQGDVAAVIDQYCTDSQA